MSVWATKWAYRQQVEPAGAKFVLVALADFADENGNCYPSQQTLAGMTGQGERTVRDHLATLEEMNLISRKHRRKEGSFTSDIFTLNAPKEDLSPAADFAVGKSRRRQDSHSPAANLAVGPAANLAAYPLVVNHQEKPSGDLSLVPVTGLNNDARTRAQNGHDARGSDSSFTRDEEREQHNQPSRKESERDPSPTPSREQVTKSEQETPSGLPTWWNAYPPDRRCTQARAKELWNAATTKPSADAMLMRLVDQKASHDWTKEQGRYVPSMEKYLTTEGWLSPIRPAPIEKNDWSWWTLDGVVFGRENEHGKLTFPPGYRTTPSDWNSARVLSFEGKLKSHTVL